MQKKKLERAICKLAIAGEQAGFSVEQMIDFLNAGLTVERLLDLITSVSYTHLTLPTNREV